MAQPLKLLFIPLCMTSALMLTSCGGGSSDSGNPTVNPDTDTDITPGTDEDADDTSDTDTDTDALTGSVALSCIDPDGGQETPMTYLDATDFDVFTDLFDQAPNTTGTTPQEVATATAPYYAGATLLSMPIEPLWASLELATCNYELYAENQCQTPFFSVDSVSIDSGVLTYSHTLRNSTVTATIADNQYSSGTFQRIDADGTVANINWSRDSDGTERFSTNSDNGSSSEFIEYPDCSGIASRVLPPSDGEPGATMDAEWSSPTGSAFSATLEWCDTVEGVIQCDTVTLP